MTDKEFQHNLNLIQDKDKAGLKNIYTDVKFGFVEE